MPSLLAALVLVTFYWTVEPSVVATRLYQIDENGTPVEMVEIPMPAMTATLSFRNGNYVYEATAINADGIESDYSDVCAFTVRRGRVRQTYP